MIPIVIICYNNYKYVDNTIKQLLKINKTLKSNIIILNNSSTDKDTTEYLSNTSIKIINNSNNGPWITSTNNAHIYNMLPDMFIMTDPDLQFNENLPSNFVESLIELSNVYKCSRIGFALDINDYDKMYSDSYAFGKSIKDWESQFWINRIPNNNYELYLAPIDTTFCLINKTYINNTNHIRIAGNYTAKHLPWYIKNILNIYEQYNTYNVGKTSYMGRIIIPYINNNYNKIIKSNELFLIHNTCNLIREIFEKMDTRIIEQVDTKLDTNKNLICMGGFGACLYGARKSKCVYFLDTSSNALNEFNVVYNDNCTNVILSTDSLSDTIEKNSGDEISLINIDMDGKEENILEELYGIKLKYNVPVLININYNNWKNKDVTRFKFLDDSIKINICVNKNVLVYL